MHRTFLATLSSAALLTATLTAGAAPAAGDDPQHCAIGTEPMIGGVTAPAEIDCFDTEAEMWGFLTGEPLPGDEITASDAAGFNADAELDAAIGADSIDVSAEGHLAAAASVLLGYAWDGTSQSGTRTQFYGSSGSCSGGSTFGFANLGTYGWNDRISSATAYAGCRGQHYQNIDYGGTSITCSPSCSTMGTLNNAASSIVYRP